MCCLIQIGDGLCSLEGRMHASKPSSTGPDAPLAPTPHLQRDEVGDVEKLEGHCEALVQHFLHLAGGGGDVQQGLPGTGGL